jgi:hypothetical protein
MKPTTGNAIGPVPHTLPRKTTASSILMKNVCLAIRSDGAGGELWFMEDMSVVITARKRQYHIGRRSVFAEKRLTPRSHRVRLCEVVCGFAKSFEFDCLNAATATQPLFQLLILQIFFRGPPKSIICWLAREMSGRKTRVAEANNAVENELENYSDEENIEENDDDEMSDELDTSSRLRQPLSYNRSLMDLYRTSL